MTFRRLAIRLLLLALTLASVAGAQTTPQASPTAKEHFAAGVAHVEDPSGPKYEEAYREFKAAYAESPIYTIALNLGYCAFFLERDQESLEMYELYLSKVGAKEIPKAQREQLEKDVRALKAGLVRVSVKTTPAKAILVDERIPTKGNTVVNRYPIESGATQLGIHPGSHRLTIVADGYQSQSWEFEAQPASVHDHDFNLIPVSDGTASERQKPASTSPGASSPAPSAPADVTPKSTSPIVYVGLAATGVFAAGAIGTGLVARSKRSDFDAVNDGTQVDEAQRLHDQTTRYLLISDICLGAALVSAGVTTYFYFAGSSSSKPAASSNAGRYIGPSIGPGFAGLSYSDRF